MNLIVGEKSPLGPGGGGEAVDGECNRLFTTVDGIDRESLADLFLRA